MFGSADLELFWIPQPEMNNPSNTTGSVTSEAVHIYPQAHLEFDGGAGPGIPERKALSQRHVLLRQQTSQRHRQITQGAFVLVIFYLCIKTEEDLLYNKSATSTI